MRASSLPPGISAKIVLVNTAIQCVIANTARIQRRWLRSRNGLERKFTYNEPYVKYAADPITSDATTA
jgi:hypothetical protein